MRRGIIHLVKWIHMPTSPMELFQILETITDDELLLVATRIKGVAGRIAWATYAKRQGYFDFEVGISKATAGKLEVQFEAKGVPAHRAPQFS